jgi:PHD/YefM family antitoxin component YafN of YafNO toxin-antitoxin module
MIMSNVITTTPIPKSIPPKKRAKLIALQDKQIRRHLRTTFFAFEPQTRDAVRPFKQSNLRECMITNDAAHVIETIESQWRINCYILSRDEYGDNHIDEETYLIQTPCRHKDIAEVVSDWHWDMIQEFKQSEESDNFITAGWIASEIGLECPTETAMTIFERMGCYDLPADWEEAQ